MSPWFMTIPATLALACLSLVGAVFAGLRPDRLQRLVFTLVALATGALLGGAFLHLLPEATERIGAEATGALALCGLGSFFLLERVIHWRHCHDTDECEVHPLSTLALLGGAVHNFLDGLVTASAFLMGPEVGLATVLMIAAHALPQEIGDFGILVHAGHTPRRAILLNSLSALTIPLGGLVGTLVLDQLGPVVPYVVAFAAGNFLYVGASDLVPELHKERDTRRALLAFGIFVFAVGLVGLLHLLPHGEA
jgi:zinc and cadmium transporter